MGVVELGVVEVNVTSDFEEGFIPDLTHITISFDGSLVEGVGDGGETELELPSMELLLHGGEGKGEF